MTGGLLSGRIGRFGAIEFGFCMFVDQ